LISPVEFEAPPLESDTSESKLIRLVQSLRLKEF